MPLVAASEPRLFNACNMHVTTGDVTNVPLMTCTWDAKTPGVGVVSDGRIFDKLVDTKPGSTS